MTDNRRLSTSDIAEVSERPPDLERAVNRAAAEAPAPDAPRPADDAPAPLFVSADADGYRTRWGAIQTGFVDEPRKAVEEADALVAEIMKRLADSFAVARRELEGQWEKNDRVSTEDLRQAMRRYRTFFERLLSV
jgi:hypothetical protein